MKNKILGIIFVLMILTTINVIMATTLTIRPNSNGTYGFWSAINCPVGSYYSCVNETPANDADYVSSGTANLKESFNFADTGLTSEKIYGIELFYRGWKYSSSKYYSLSFLETNNREYSGAALSFSSAPSLKSVWIQKNPITGNLWTIEEINNLKAGMVNANSAYSGARISQMYIEVDYDSPIAYPYLNITSLNFYEYDMNGTGLKVQVVARITNNGQDTAEASTTVLQGLSVKNDATPLLRPTKVRDIYWTYDCTAPHTFTVTADADGIIAESDETNNVKSVYIDCII